MRPFNYVVGASIHLPLTFSLQCENHVQILLYTNLMVLKEMVDLNLKEKRIGSFCSQDARF
jgi:hypothetical protein